MGAKQLTYSDEARQKLLAGVSKLARAVRNESARAVRNWFGVNHGTVARWRKALGVDRVNNRQTNRLIRQSAVKARRPHAGTASS